MQRLTQVQLAKVLGLSQPTVSRLVKDNVLVAERDGTFGLEKNVQRYIAHIKRHEAPTELQRERTSLVKAQREAAELALKERRGELLNRQDVYISGCNLVSKMVKRLLLIPPTAAPQLVPHEKIAEAQALLEKLVHEALEELRHLPDEYET